MADYYPLIAKAVAGLDKNTGDARRGLYERARTALVTQLRGVTPALGESDITRERLALEEAIRKVEAEAARKARFDPPEPRRVEPEVPAAGAPRPEPTPPAPPAPPPAESSPPGDPSVSNTAAELRRTVRAKGGSLSDEGLRGFRDVVAEAENLGGATMQAGRSAREAFNSVPSANPEGDRLEPRMEPEGLRPRDRRAAEPMPMPAPPRRDLPPRRDPRAESAPPPLRGEPMRPATVRRRDADMPPPVADLDMPSTTEPMLADDNFPARDFDGNGRYGRDRDIEPAVESGRPPRKGARAFPESKPLAEARARPQRAPGSSRRYIVMTIALLVLVSIGGLIAWQWPTLSDLAGSFTSSKPAATPPKESATAAKKIPDRVGADQRAPSSVPGVAQRVVLYEEDPADPAGKRYVGSAVWRTETVSPGPGLAPEMVVRADIEIPERKMTMRWSLRRNADKALPASHTVEIVFTLPPDFPNQGIQNIPGILMKQAEQTRGVPLAGLAVKVTTNFFLIGLSAVESDMQRNIQILKERSWFDVPLVYTNGRRAILAVEKGTPGERAFADAFAAWKQ